MKIKLTLILGLLIACSAGCLAKGKSKASPKEKPICAEWLMPEPSVYQKLGKNLASVLFAPKSVKCYSVEWQDTVRADQLEPYFAQDSLIAKLSKEQIAVLQYSLLSDSANYSRNDVVVTAPYVPALDFEFEKKGEIAHVVVSLNDFSWSIIYDDKKQFNYNYNSPTFSRLAKFYYTQIHHE